MDPILYWNDVALEANRVSFTNGAGEQPGPTLSSRALAIVHLAMYDAFAQINNDFTNFPTYQSGLPTVPSGATIEAAIAAAAYTTLTYLFPTQKPFFDQKLAEAGEVLNSGHAFGKAVAEMLIDGRRDDPSASDRDFFPPKGIGKHKKDPDNPQQDFHGPFYGSRSKTFAVTERAPLRLDAPYAVGSSDYTKALQNVYGKGIAPELMGTLPAGADKRTAGETIIGIFWGYDGSKELGTPPRLYNQIIREIAKQQATNVAENARLFALVNCAMGDAGILAWEEKYIHNFWRPVVGVREDPDNPDTGWLPLGAPNNNKYDPKTKTTEKNFTPPFPAYPSGHATFGSAAFEIARLYFKKIRSGVDVAKNLKIVSDEYNGVSQDNKGTVRPKLERTFTKGFEQMIEENGFSRIYLGVHWSFDAFALRANGKPDLTKKIGGTWLGINIAKDIFSHDMKLSNV